MAGDLLREFAVAIASGIAIYALLYLGKIVLKARSNSKLVVSASSLTLESPVDRFVKDSLSQVAPGEKDPFILAYIITRVDIANKSDNTSGSVELIVTGDRGIFLIIGGKVLILESNSVPYNVGPIPPNSLKTFLLAHGGISSGKDIIITEDGRNLKVNPVINFWGSFVAHRKPINTLAVFMVFWVIFLGFVFSYDMMDRIKLVVQ